MTFMSLENRIKKEILIRADADSDTGLGHVIRCLGLAQMLSDSYRITFVCNKIPDEIANSVHDKGFELIRIESEEEFREMVRPEQIVILDGYGFTSEYQLKIKQKGCKLIYIDDLYDGEYYADLIINHSPGVEQNKYTAQPYTRFALGLEFSLMRPVFLEEARKKRVHDSIDHVFICCGGSDPRNFTEKILKGVLGFSEFKKITVVTGPGYGHRDKINRLADEDNRVKHYSSVDEYKMRDLMLGAGLAIVPTSGMVLEAICCSCNILCFWYEKNQAMPHNFFTSRDYVKSFGDNSVSFKKNAMKEKIVEILNKGNAGNYRKLRKKIACVKENINNAIASI